VIAVAAGARGRISAAETMHQLQWREVKLGDDYSVEESIGFGTKFLSICTICRVLEISPVLDTPTGDARHCRVNAASVRCLLLTPNVAHERPSKRAKPACECPSRWAGYAPIRMNVRGRRFASACSSFGIRGSR
jgi:hypothetical protein